MQADGKMHVDCWIQQVTTNVGAVTCRIQQSVSPKQVVGFSCLFNFEVDQLISKVIIPFDAAAEVKRGGDFSLPHPLPTSFRRDALVDVDQKRYLNTGVPRKS